MGLSASDAPCGTAETLTVKGLVYFISFLTGRLMRERCVCVCVAGVLIGTAQMGRNFLQVLRRHAGRYRGGSSAQLVRCFTNQRRFWLNLGSLLFIPLQRWQDCIIIHVARLGVLRDAGKDTDARRPRVAIPEKKRIDIFCANFANFGHKKTNL